MIILLMLAIVCAVIAGLKCLEGISMSVIFYFAVAAVCLVIYIVGSISKRRNARN